MVERQTNGTALSTYIHMLLIRERASPPPGSYAIMARHLAPHSKARARLGRREF